MQTSLSVAASTEQRALEPEQPVLRPGRVRQALELGPDSTEQPERQALEPRPDSMEQPEWLASEPEQLEPSPEREPQV